MKDDLLEIGDIIYIRRHGDDIIEKATVNKITRTQASSGGYRFKRKVWQDHVDIIGDYYAWNRPYGRLENPEIAKEYEKYLLKGKVSKLKTEIIGLIQNSELPIEKLEKIKKFLEEN